MATVAFDTLRFSQRLTEAGLTSAQAAGAAAATAEAIGDLVGQLSTKHDHAMLRQELKADAKALRQELAADAAALRQELKTEVSTLRQEMVVELSTLRRDMQQLELRMTVKLGAMIAGAVAVTAALVRLL
jgi:hypothetical protein